MRELSIEEMEELEDIEIELDKEIELAKNEYNDFYIQTNQGKLIINKKEYSDKYIIDFCKDGFICENPNIRKMFEDKEFTKNELINFIKNFCKSIEEIFDEKIIPTHLFLEDYEDEYIVEGINLGAISYTCNKAIIKTPTLIVYLKDKNNNLFRLEFFEKHTTLGENFGKVYIMELDNLPKEIFYIPKEGIRVKVNKADFFEIILNFYENNYDFFIGEIGNSINGTNIWKPSGFINDTFSFASPKPALNKGFFNYDKNKIEDFLKLKERIK